MKKTTSKNLSKRLKHYGALSLAVAGVAGVNGQIVHHIVGSEGDGSSDYFLNLNPIDGITPGGVADAIDDFRIIEGFVPSYSSRGSVRLEVLNSNAVLGSVSGFVYPFALEPGYVVSNGLSNWQNIQFQTLDFYSCLSGYGNSNWCGKINKYLGLRFDISGNTHFGWAKLTVDYAGVNWSLSEYAFNATAGAPITTGQTTLGIEVNVLSKIKIIALHKSIGLYNLPESTEYRLYSMTGQSIFEGKINNSTYVIEANTVAAGIYIIELKDKNSSAVLRKKIVL